MIAKYRCIIWRNKVYLPCKINVITKRRHVSCKNTDPGVRWSVHQFVKSWVNYEKSNDEMHWEESLDISGQPSDCRIDSTIMYLLFYLTSLIRFWLSGRVKSGFIVFTWNKVNLGITENFKILFFLSVCVCVPRCIIKWRDQRRPEGIRSPVTKLINLLIVVAGNRTQGPLQAVRTLTPKPPL